MWRGGSLDDAHYDEFVLRVKLPAHPGPLWLRVLVGDERAGAMAEEPAKRDEPRK